jgi:hypothetical protein
LPLSAQLDRAIDELCGTQFFVQAR